MKRLTLALILTVFSFSYAIADEKEEIVLSVPEMSCPSCAASVETELKKIKGIADFNINIRSKSVVVTLDAGSTVSKTDLNKAIRAAGFKVKN